MAKEWKTEIVQNLTAEDVSNAAVQDFDPETKYEDVLSQTLTKAKELPGYLFTDEKFPPGDASLFYTDTFRAKLPPDVEWRRPYMMSENASFLKDGFSREDVIQGKLADCYFVSALSTVANRPKATRMMVPKGQKMTESKDYTGVFHFRFWHFGTWVDIVVDDWLPTVTSGTSTSTLLFGRSSDEDEYWISLVEKAYSKLNGSYEAISSEALTMDALEDMTGGIAVRYLFRDKTEKRSSDLFKQMRRAVRNRGLVSIGISGDGGYDKDVGLASNHSYSVTLAETVDVGAEKLTLFRVRNPWGHGSYEWKQDWSDNDSENWDRVSAEDKKILHYPAGEGEWYMCFEDIEKHFDTLTICTGAPDFNEDGQAESSYYYTYAKGSWKVGKNAGGSPTKSLEYFSFNPQYLIEAPNFANGRLSSFIELMQRYTHRQMEGRSRYKIGYRFYEVPDFLVDHVSTGRAKVPYQYFHQMRLVEYRDDCIGIRGISFLEELDPGLKYLFIPFTEKFDEGEDFLIRLYTEQKINMLELH